MTRRAPFAIPDKPRDRPSVVDVAPLIRRIYDRSCTGCCLHIVTDDGNVDDAHVDFCIETATGKGHEDCLAAARMLRAMTKTQRRKAGPW